MRIRPFNKLNLIFAENGADPALKDRDGLTALVHAIRTNSARTAELLATYAPKSASAAASGGAGLSNQELSSHETFLSALTEKLTTQLEQAKQVLLRL